MKTTNKRRVGLAGVLSGALAMVLVPAVAATAAPAAEQELITNPEFTQGASGWRTNSQAQHLTITTDDVAVLTTTANGHAVLNDRVNTVQDLTEGSTYSLNARVRTTTPNVSGALRVREVAPAGVDVSQASFTLRDTSWHDVSLEVTSVHTGGHLDVNVVAWNLGAGNNLQIDSVSMRETTVAPEPEPEPEAPVDECRAEPPAGTVYGSSVSTRGQTLPQAIDGVDDTFGKVEAIRHFRPGLPLAWDSRNMQHLSDRTLITSFKAHPTEITSGSLDAFFTDWFATAPEDQTIYWSYFHEPEDNINRGEFTAEQYRAAWRHLAEIEQDACKANLHSTLILTEWTMQPASKRDYRTYDAGPEYVSVLGFDPYNGVTSLTRDFYESAEDLLGPIASKMAADGRPWGIAELGSRQVASDTDGSGRAAWLTEVTDYAEKHGARFITYYQSVAKGGDFRLLDEKSNDVWRALVAK